MSTQAAPRETTTPTAHAPGSASTSTPIRERVWWPVKGTIGAGVLGGIATAAGMALTATSGWLILRASERPVILTIMTAIVAVRTFGIARPVFRYWERLRSHDAALADLSRARTTAYDRLIPLTPARLGRRRRADVLAGVVDDLTDVVEAQVRVSVPVISAAIAIVLAIVLTATVSLPIALILTALALAIAVICVVAHRLERHALDELLAARAETSRVAELVTAQALELGAIGAWPRALGWLDEAQDTLVRVSNRQARGRALTAGVFLLAVGAATAATAYAAQSAAASPAVKALLVLVPVAMADAITPLTDAMRALARARGSADRITHLLEQDPAVRAQGTGEAPAADGRPVAIATDGLTASWTGAKTDLPATDLRIEPGEHVAVTGPNGSGKSTLLAALARHLDPQSGSLTWDGAEAVDLDTDSLRSRIALVDDETHVFASSLRENLRLAAPSPDEVTDEQILSAIRDAGLDGWYAGLPDGLDTRLGADGRGVSGGERSRLGIARALVSQRPHILLDEPVAHLDAATARSVVRDLVGHGGGAPAGDTPEPGTDPARRTLVMVTHRPEGIEDFDRTISLAQPSTTRGGTP